MNAMEKMLENVLTSLTGMTGLEMREVVLKSIHLLVELNDRLERIENALNIDATVKDAITIEHNKQEAA